MLRVSLRSVLGTIDATHDWRPLLSAPDLTRRPEQLSISDFIDLTNRIAAEREQWNDGSNTLAVAPGKICVYQRNSVTNDVLYKEGLDLLVVPSAELSRGRGGPRCMSMPFEREDI